MIFTNSLIAFTHKYYTQEKINRPITRSIDLSVSFIKFISYYDAAIDQ